MARSDAVTRSVLADQVKEWLLEGILDGSYPPNSRIVETSVAKELGTSQAPVREALRGLEAMGVVEITPFRGARVRRLDRDELVEAYVVRSAIESLGARLAVRLMTAGDLDELVGLGEQMQRAAAVGDGHTVAEADARFHGRIMELSGNGTLVRVWRSLEPLARTYITLAVPGADPQWTADLHDPILDALQRRDTRAVVRALQHHFEEASARMASQLDQQLEAPAVREAAVAVRPSPERGSSDRGGAAPRKPTTAKTAARLRP